MVEVSRVLDDDRIALDRDLLDTADDTGARVTPR